MKKIVWKILLLAATMNYFMAFPSDLHCPTALCPMRETEFGFTIPVGSVLSIIEFVTKIITGTAPLPPLTLLVPNIKVELGTGFSGYADLSCSIPCCPESERLVMDADLVLSGTATLWTIPPREISYRKWIPVIRGLRDNSLDDELPAPCSIRKGDDRVPGWSYENREVEVHLAFPLISALSEAIHLTQPLPIRGVGMADCALSVRCSAAEEELQNVPPRFVHVPYGDVEIPAHQQGEYQFEVLVEDPDENLVGVFVESQLPDGISVNVNKVHEREGRPGSYTYRVAIAISDADRFSPGDRVGITLVAYDSFCGTNGRYVLHERCSGHFSFSLKFIPNRPPLARELTVTMTVTEFFNHLIESSEIKLRLQADDPDLLEYGDNLGYEYYFIWESPLLDKWICPCGFGHYELKFLLGLDDQWCVFGPYDRPELTVSCVPGNLEWLLLNTLEKVQRIGQSMWVARYWVVEVSPRLDFGFASLGSWSLTVTNDPPEYQGGSNPHLFPPLEAEVGEVMEQEIRAVDPDGDHLFIVKTCGPGEFPRVEGEGEASGTYRWRARGPSASYLVTFLAEDEWGAKAYGFWEIRVLVPPRVDGGRVVLHPGESTALWVYAEDPDSASLELTPGSQEGIELEVVGEEPVRDYEDFGQGGRIYQLRVRVGEGVAPGSYEIPLVVTDPDGLTGEAVLVVEVTASRI